MQDTTTPGYTMIAGMPVHVGGKDFTVEFQRYPDGHATAWLTGKRGGHHHLRGFLNEKAAGLFHVISWKSGAPLRDKCGRTVLVMWVGDTIEDVTR